MSSTKSISMRDSYFKALYPIFLEDNKTMLISADNGAPYMDPISELPNQFRNVGIAEQQLVGMACGHAREGRKVWVYAIDAFVTLRCIEFIKLDMCAMNLPITAIGVGSGYAYDIMGPTHHGVGIIATMRPWPNLTIWSPSDGAMSSALAQISYENGSPQYIRFDREGLPDLYGNGTDFSDGILVPKKGSNVTIVATGVMVHQALKIAKELEKFGMDAEVLDLFRLKPLNEEALLGYVGSSRLVVTLEEDFLTGGMGSSIAELFVDNGVETPLLRIGQGQTFVFDLGGREAIWEKYGLDEASIVKKILTRAEKIHFFD